MNVDSWWHEEEWQFVMDQFYMLGLLLPRYKTEKLIAMNNYLKFSYKYEKNKTKW